MSYKILLLILLITTGANGYSLSLPVNACRKDGEKIHLIIEILNTFKPLNNPQNPITQFIPKSETPQNWSQNITTSTCIGKKESAESAIINLKKLFLTNDTSATVIREEYKKENGFSLASLIITCTLNNRREVLFAKYYSGPFDCSGFIYSVVLNDEINLDNALKKINDFESNRTKIINF